MSSALGRCTKGNGSELVSLCAQKNRLLSFIDADPMPPSTLYDPLHNSEHFLNDDVQSMLTVSAKTRTVLGVAGCHSVPHAAMAQESGTLYSVPRC